MKQLKRVLMLIQELEIMIMRRYLDNIQRLMSISWLLWIPYQSGPKRLCMMLVN
jgi:hypothetical protein